VGHQFVATGSGDTTVRLWNVKSGGMSALLVGHSNDVADVTFSSDGATLASSSADGSIRLWDVASRNCTKVLKTKTPVIMSRFSNDGRLLASSYEDGTSRIWNVCDGVCNAILRKGPNATISRMFFNPDEKKFMASGTKETTIRVWNVQSRSSLATFSEHKGYVLCTDFSIDGQWLASGASDNCVRVWDISADQCVAILRGHLGWVCVVSISPDGQKVASASPNDFIRLWDINAAKEIGRVSGPAGSIKSLAFSSDGKLLSWGSLNHYAGVLSLEDPESIVSEANASSRNLGAVKPEDMKLLAILGNYGLDLAATNFEQAELDTQLERLVCYHNRQEALAVAQREPNLVRSERIPIKDRTRCTIA